MMMKFPTFRYPRALALAARNRPLKPSSLALVCKECQRSRIRGNCLSRLTNAPRTGSNSRQSAAYSATCLRKRVIRHLAACCDSARRTRRGSSLTRQALMVAKPCSTSSRSAFSRFCVRVVSAPLTAWPQVCGKERRRHVTNHLDDVFGTAFMGFRERAEPGQAFPCPCRESRGPRACRDGPGR